MRRAYSLVELLLVISIVAIVIGLLLSALQKVRQSANSIQSKNQLRQLSHSCAGYVADHDGAIPRMATPVQGETFHEFSTYVLLMPYLEQRSEYDARLNSVLPESRLVNANPVFFSPFESNKSEIDAVKDVLVSYSANAMVFMPPAWNTPYSIVRQEAFLKDGYSNTVMFAESRSICKNKKRFYYIQYPTSRSDEQGPQCATFADHSLTINKSFCEDYYPITSGSPPVSRAADGVTFQVVPTDEECDPRQPNALSPLGLHCAFADGSVRIFRKGVDPAVFWGAVTPAGGEVIAFD